MTDMQEFRWSFRKKGKQVFNICTHVIILGSVSLAFANPMDGVVTGGTASIISTPAELQINQSSNSAMIDWKSFDIAAGETTHFYQPNSNAVALNRVVNSTQASSINGNLLANGKIFVINQNGVLLGKTANVNTTGFIASTADITNNSFMNSTGTYDFNIAGNADASVINKGHISVQDAGLVAFVAPHVSNEGLIEGNLAKVQLGAGDMYGVDLYGDGLISLAVTAPQGGAKRKISADNSGPIITDGGKILVTAAAASNMIDSVINNSGVIEAQGLVVRNGEVILTGSGAHVKVSGKIDVSGKNGGGKVKIGGDYQGKGTLAHAATTEVTKDAVIKANATDTGNGGTVVVWSDEATYFQGTALAQGGANSGNGGLVETSSEGYLSFHGGTVDTSAANGEFGTWLLDPTNFILHLGDGDTSVGIPNDGNTSTTAWLGIGSNGTTGTTAEIYESEIEGQNTSFVLSAQNSFSVDDGIVGTYGGTLGDGIISLQAGKSLRIETRNNSSDSAGTINLTGSSFGSALLFKTTDSGINHGRITINGSTDGFRAGDIILSRLETATGNITVETNNGSITANGDIATMGGEIILTSGTGGSITTKNLTIDSILGSISKLDIHSANALDINGDILVTNIDNNNAPLSSSAVAILRAENNINVTGNITVSGTDIDQPDASSTGILSVISTNGDIAIGGGVDIESVTMKTSDDAGNASSHATATLTANNGSISISNGIAVDAFASNANTGDNATATTLLTLHVKDNIVINGGVNGTATSLSDIKDMANATVSLISTDGEIFLNSPNDPTARAGDGAEGGDDALVHQAYIGFDISLTDTEESGLAKDTAHLFISGRHIISLDVTADPQTKIYGSSDPLLTYTAFFGYNGAPVPAGYIIGSLDRTAGEDVGSYAITQGTLAPAPTPPIAGHYVISYTGNFLTITPYSLLVTADAQNKVYGSADPALTYTHGTLQNEDPESVFTGALGRDVGETVADGPYAINQNTLSAGSNYTIDYIGNFLTISPYLLSVIADAQSKVFGSVDPLLTYTHGTLQNEDSESVFTGALSRDAGETVEASPYAINLGTLSAGGNYTIDYTGNFLTITPLSVTTADQGPALEIDALGRPIISIANKAIVYDPYFEPVEILTLNTDVSIATAPSATGAPTATGAPSAGGAPTAATLAGLEPAAGGPEDKVAVTDAQELANIEPAAGGAVGSDITCANNFLDNRPCPIQ
jgi:filamentous hemagglutinin family protein